MEAEDAEGEGRHGRDVLAMTQAPETIRRLDEERTGEAPDNLRQFFEQHPERRYVMFGGKGGLGKTTFSAATGYWLAQQGHKVLVFSVDPQASLSDIFEKDIFGKRSTPIPTSRNTRTRFDRRSSICMAWKRCRTR
jgi:hypothetical protein